MKKTDGPLREFTGDDPNLIVDSTYRPDLKAPGTHRVMAGDLKPGDVIAGFRPDVDLRVVEVIRPDELKGHVVLVQGDGEAAGVVDVDTPYPVRT